MTVRADADLEDRGGPGDDVLARPDKATRCGLEQPRHARDGSAVVLPVGLEDVDRARGWDLDRHRHDAVEVALDVEDAEVVLRARATRRDGDPGDVVMDHGRGALAVAARRGHREGVLPRRGR